MTDLRDQLQQTLGSAYTVERELGGGGMSRVLLAHDNSLGRKVVVKILPPELAATVSNERFRREIMLAAALQHPHIIGVLSTGEVDGVPYFIMPYVDGESLRARIERGPLGIPETVRILRDVARALAYAHERGVVHRDIKPDNVLISSGSAAVADFGVAKAIVAAAGGRDRSARGERGTGLLSPATLTVIGTSLGTPTYMAPEQAAADPATDHRADIYAFGVMAYEMITGAPPFRASSPRALLAAQLTELPKPLARHRKQVPQALSDIVMRCLEKDPDHRPQSADELVAALDDPAVISGAFVSAPWTSGAGHPGMARGPRWLVPTIAAAVLLAAAGGGLVLSRSRDADLPAAATAAATANPARSIAVLPMVYIGPDSTDAYFADGMTEELTSRLGRVKGLRVASRTAALSVRDKNASVAEIGKLLNVSSLLEGTVQRDGGRLRLTARLIDVDDGLTLWSDVYESEVKDVFAVQDEISQEIVSALGHELGTGTDSSAATVSAPNVEAYNEYLRGRYFLDRRGEESLRQALEHFMRAVRLDSTYALAHAGIADVYTLLPLYGNTRGEDMWRTALRAADRALALDSTIVEGYAARGNVHNATWRWAAAERDLRKAIALRPGYASAHQWLGENLLVNGRVDEALAELARAAELDPVSPIIAGSYALALGAARRFDEALARGHLAVDLDRSLYVPRLMLGTINLYAGQKADAVRELRAALALGEGSPMVKGMLGFAYAVAGERDKAMALLGELERAGTGPNVASAIARIQLGLGAYPSALDWLERAVERHDSFFTSESLASPLFDPIRADPRFAAIVTSTGLDARVVRGPGA